MKLMSNTRAGELLQQFVQLYSQRDIPGLLALFIHDAELLGTGVDEHRIGLQQLKEQFTRDFSQAANMQAVQIGHTMQSPNNPTWASGAYRVTLQIDDKNVVLEPLRATIVVAEEQGQWKIAHMHCSFPAADQPVGQSYPKNN